ncbi:MAG: hypothetical protein ACM3X4_12180 [Ignavibacteriales bacterium]
MTMTWSNRLRLISFSLVLLAEVLAQYIPLFPVTLAGVLSAIAGILAFAASNTTSRVLSLALMGAGAALFVYCGASPVVVVSSFAENIGVLMVMALVPLLGVVIDLGGYPEALALLARRMKNPILLFAFSLLLVYLLGSVLLTAAIALAWMILAPAVAEIGEEPSTFLAVGLARGYVSASLWSPASPTLAITLAVSGVRWPAVVRPGLILSAAVLTCTMAFAYAGSLRNLSQRAHRLGHAGAASREKSIQKQAAPQDRTAERAPFARLSTLAAALVLFMVAIASCNLMGYTVYQAIVPCTAAAFTLWALAIGESRRAFASALGYFTRKLPGLSDQFLLMITAGFAGRAFQIASSGLPVDVFNGLAGLSTFWFSLIVSALVWGISLVGVHPLIGTTIVSSMVSPYIGHHSILSLSCALMLGSCLGFCISPVSAMLMVMSSCSGKSTLDLGLKMQWKFVMASWIIGCKVLSVILP